MEAAFSGVSEVWLGLDSPNFVQESPQVIPYSSYHSVDGRRYEVVSMFNACYSSI